MYRIPRLALWAILLIGVILIVIPFAIGLPGKASAGQTLLDDLHPLMQPASINQTASYYDNTFVRLGPVSVVAVKASKETPKLIAALATDLHLTPAHLESFLGTSFPATASLLGGLPALSPVFANVAPGLTHYKPLVKAIVASEGNYAKVDSLPDLRLFTWLLVVPGVALLLIAGGSLLSNRRRTVAPVPATTPA
jgi:hypothetical protein